MNCPWSSSGGDSQEQVRLAVPWNPLELTSLAVGFHLVWHSSAAATAVPLNTVVRMEAGHPLADLSTMKGLSGKHLVAEQSPTSMRCMEDIAVVGSFEEQPH